MADAQPQRPNRAAPTGNLGVRGRRRRVAKVGRKETQEDMRTNTRSSTGTPNLSAQNQRRNG